MPEKMTDVLFLTKTGNIHKGFLNLGGMWLIQNNNQLIARVIRDSRNVVAWRNLPNVNDEGWKTEERPETGSRVLIKDSISNEINIAYVGKVRWIIRNSPKDHITFWANTNSPWMPLPEPPNNEYTEI